MNSSDLFSHPQKPEVIPASERSAEPVQAPAFSDRNDSTAADTPPSS
jgi:hypothetical protein